jgi:hypothetical protein
MTIALAQINEQRQGISRRAESFTVFTAFVKVRIRGGVKY